MNGDVVGNSTAVPVLVQTGPLLSSFVGETDREAAVRTIEGELVDLAVQLGVPVRPSVTLEQAQEGAFSDLMRLFVGDRRCRFPASAIAEALAFLEGTECVPENAESLVARLRETWVGERTAQLLAAICRAAISEQASILMPPGAEASLLTALDLGVSIGGDRDGGLDSPQKDPDAGEQAPAGQAAPEIAIHVDPAYLPVLSREDPEAEMFPFLRDGLYGDLGLSLPPFHFHPDRSLPSRGFSLRFNSVMVARRIGLHPDTILVNGPPERLPLNGVEARRTLYPGATGPGSLVGREHQETLEAAGWSTWRPLQFLVLCVAAEARRRAHWFMTGPVAAGMMSELEAIFPALGDACRERIANDRMADLLRELLRDGVQIRNMRRIAELALRYETARPPDAPADDVSFVRAGLAEAIAFKAGRSTETVVVYLVDPELERAVVDAYPALAERPSDGPLAELVIDLVRRELSALPETVFIPALLTREAARRPLRTILRHEFPTMTVLSYSDLPPHYNVQPIARISAA